MELGVKAEVIKVAEVLRGALEKYYKGLSIDQIEHEYLTKVTTELTDKSARELEHLLDMLETGKASSMYLIRKCEGIDGYIPRMMNNIIDCIKERDDFQHKYVFITSVCAIGEAFVKEHRMDGMDSAWYDAALVRILDEDGTHLEVCINDKFTRLVSKKNCFDTLEEAVKAKQECLRKWESIKKQNGN